MIIRVQLARTAFHRLIAWLNSVAIDEVCIIEALFNVESTMLELVSRNKPTVYALEAEFTKSGVREMICLGPEDLKIERIKDEGEN